MTSKRSRRISGAVKVQSQKTSVPAQKQVGRTNFLLPNPFCSIWVFSAGMGLIYRGSEIYTVGSSDSNVTLIKKCVPHAPRIMFKKIFGHCMVKLTHATNHHMRSFLSLSLWSEVFTGDARITLLTAQEDTGPQANLNREMEKEEKEKKSYTHFILFF